MIKKKPFNQLETGWLSPEGDFYPAEYMEHLDVADGIWRELKGDFSPYDVVDRLLTFGWCEIQCGPALGNKFSFYFERHLTPEQKRTIKTIIEENLDRLDRGSLIELRDEFEIF